MLNIRKLLPVAAVVVAGLWLGACSNSHRGYAGSPMGGAQTATLEDEGGDEVVVGPESSDADRAYASMHRPGRHRKRVCPPGTTPMGSVGCFGTPITSAEATRPHDVIGFKGPCREGATRVVWKEGEDAFGRKVRWRIVQRQANCRKLP